MPNLEREKCKEKGVSDLAFQFVWVIKTAATEELALQIWAEVPGFKGVNTYFEMGFNSFGSISLRQENHRSQTSDWEKNLKDRPLNIGRRGDYLLEYGHDTPCSDDKEGLAVLRQAYELVKDNADIESLNELERNHIKRLLTRIDETLQEYEHPHPVSKVKIPT